MKEWNDIQLEEGVCDLEHEDVRVVVFVADEYAFASSSHAMFLIVLF
jgi:hypothetical protein